LNSCVGKPSPIQEKPNRTQLKKKIKSNQILADQDTWADLTKAIKAHQWCDWCIDQTNLYAVRCKKGGSHATPYALLSATAHANDKASI